MGRRRVGGSGSGYGDRTLLQCIEAAGKNYSTIDELVDRLRSSYPSYSRLKVRPFRKRVERVLIMDSSARNDASMDDCNDRGDNKRRKIDGGGSSSSLASAISSSEGSDSSTSDMEPEVDLMKSMMQEDLLRKSKKLHVAEEVMELDNINKGVKVKELNNLNKGRRGRDGNELVDRVMFKNLGGMNGVISHLRNRVIVPLYHPNLPRHLGVKPTAGILLHGPPGCGKTTLAHAIANETGWPFYKISDASAENIREVFSKACRTAPSIVFIDEIDTIASKRENLQRETDRRIVRELLICMEESRQLVKPVLDDDDDDKSIDCQPGHVLVIGATNRPHALDPALRRPGRFDREIALGVPDEAARAEILSALTSDFNVEGGFDLVKLARSTPGFVGADLQALAKGAGELAMGRIVDKRESELTIKQQSNKDYSVVWWKQHWSPDEMANLHITMADFEEAVKTAQPSLTREGFSNIPNVKWDDVGGLHHLRLEFDRQITRRIKYPKKCESAGLKLEAGFLLYGPPGCGKTLIAKAVATEAGATFIHIKGPDLLNKYVGESESAVRTIFSRARTCTPCIVFFDEVDALATKRGKEGGRVCGQVLNQLLVELDGGEQRRGVYVIGATNRPEVIDEALLRPGRLGKLMYVPLPTPDERGMIMKALAKKMLIDPDVDLIALAKSSCCDNLSGADLFSLMEAASNAAMDESPPSILDGSSDDELLIIKDAHFTSAMKNISPSVSDKKMRYYKRLSERFNAK